MRRLLGLGLCTALICAGCPEEKKRAPSPPPRPAPRRPSATPTSGPLAQKILYTQAKSLLVAAKSEAARATFQRAIDAAPKGPEVANCYLGLAAALGDLERHDEAVSAYREVVRRQPKNAEALSALALGLEAAGKSDEAQRTIRQAAEQSPDNLVLLQDLARLQHDAGASEAAQQTYRRYEKRRQELLARVSAGDLNHRLDALAWLARARDDQTVHWIAERLPKERGTLRVALIEALEQQRSTAAAPALKALLVQKGLSAAEHHAAQRALAALVPQSQPSARQPAVPSPR